LNEWTCLPLGISFIGGSAFSLRLSTCILIGGINVFSSSLKLFYSPHNVLELIDIFGLIEIVVTFIGVV